MEIVVQSDVDHLGLPILNIPVAVIEAAGWHVGDIIDVDIPMAGADVVLNKKDSRT